MATKQEADKAPETQPSDVDPVVSPLSKAERLLLDAYIEALKGSKKSRKKFRTTCEFLEGATKAAKALVKLKRKAG